MRNILQLEYHRRQTYIGLLQKNLHVDTDTFKKESRIAPKFDIVGEYARPWYKVKDIGVFFDKERPDCCFSHIDERLMLLILKIFDANGSMRDRPRFYKQYSLASEGVNDYHTISYFNIKRYSLFTSMFVTAAHLVHTYAETSPLGLMDGDRELHLAFCPPDKFGVFQAPQTVWIEAISRPPWERREYHLYSSDTPHLSYKPNRHFLL